MPEVTWSRADVSAFDIRPRSDKRGPLVISRGASKDSESIRRGLEQFGKAGRVGSIPPDLRSDVPIAEQLYRTAAALKIMASKISMHISPEWRRQLFVQIDHLLSIENWDGGDTLPNERSFATYLRVVAYEKRLSRPSIGISSDGNILAAWRRHSGQLSIEFLPDDLSIWMIFLEDVDESAAGRAAVLRLREVLSPYSVYNWIIDADAD